MNNRKITRADVVQAAASKGIPVLEALTAMQSVAAKMKDKHVLSQLCEIKSEILFGDEMDEQIPPHTCKYCGAPSWLDESDQSPPPDYCHESDHGLPDNDGW